MRNYLLICSLLLTCLGAVNVRAQVTIGAERPPKEGALLDLSQGSGGLLLPRISLDDIANFQLDTIGGNTLGIADSALIKGMLVYNVSKTTTGGNSTTGLFVWSGKNWEAVNDGSSKMTASTPNGIALAANSAAAADGSNNIDVKIDDPDCTMSGEYQFILLSGNATLSANRSVTPEFTLTFDANNLGIPHLAIVHVINPCFKNAYFIFYQEASPCGDIFNITSIKQYNNALCGSGGAYAYVETVTDNLGATLSESSMDSLRYYWMLGNTQVAEGRGVYLNKRGIYTVYADMQGCGQSKTITVASASGSGSTPTKPTVVATNDGIICGNNPVILSVLNLQTGDSVRWFQNGILIDTLKSKEISLDASNFIGDWYAVIDNNNGCWSQPSNIQSISHTLGANALPAPVLKINDTDPAQLTTLCKGSSVLLQVTNLAAYGNTYELNWYINGTLLGRTRGDIIYDVPDSVTSCIISVKITTQNNCPVTTSTGELAIAINNSPSVPIISWQNNPVTQAVICLSSPALLTGGPTGAKMYQWFRNENYTTPYSENDSTNIFEAKEIGRYRMRYQDQSGCWSAVSQQVEVLQSAKPTIQWSVQPESIELFETEEVYKIVSLPPADRYTWRILHNDSVDYSQYFPLTVLLGDSSTVVVKLPDMGAIPGGQIHNGGTSGIDTLTNMTLEVTATNICGSTSSKKHFVVVNKKMPITSVSLTGSTKAVPKDLLVYTANASTGTGPRYYRGWIYLENMGSMNSIHWSNGFGSTGEITIPTITQQGATQTVPAWCYDSDDPQYPNGLGQGQYKKVLIQQWTTNNTFSIHAFLEGKHYIVVEAANDIRGLNTLRPKVDGTPDIDAIYSYPLSTDGTAWDAPVISQTIELLVEKDLATMSAGKPSGINYTLFMGGKSCLDVHQTGDNAAQAWGTNRLPLNVRPNDFSTGNLVNGNYQFKYTFKGGSASIANSGDGNSPLTKSESGWTPLIPSIEYRVVDPNMIVASVSGKGTETAIVNIKPTVVNAAKGRTRNNALKFTLYAIYTANGNDYYKDSIVISVQDAACGCPAKMSSSTWILDMCHTAGADFTKDPYSNDDAAVGKFYKWGNKTYSITYAAGTSNRNNVRAVSSNGVWDETQNPCPYGSRVVTDTESKNILDHSLNPKTANATVHAHGYVPTRAVGGFYYGSNADYPGGRYYHNDRFYTWSSNAPTYGNDRQTAVNYAYAAYTTLGREYPFWKAMSLPVRCVQDGQNATYTP